VSPHEIMDLMWTALYISIPIASAAVLYNHVARKIPYRYSSLPPGHSGIRLLRLLPNKDRAAAITCELFNCSLESGQEIHVYEALSYVWGDPNTTVPISIDGHRFDVTENLHTALLHLRDRSIERIIWVDVICINQTDLKEREEQVKMMAVIYRQANSVVSWLGEATNDSEEAIGLIRTFGPFARSYLQINIPHTLARYKETMHWHDFFETFYEFPMELQNWTALWRLLDRPYWTRVWMVQELIGGGPFKENRGVLVCGTASVDKALFDWLCMLIMSGPAMSSSYRPVEGSTTEPSRTFDLMGHPRAFVMWEAVVECAFGPLKGHGLDHLIKATKRLKATDSRDKIYAIIGLAPEKYHIFPADYSKPLRDVLVDFVKFMLRTDGNLDILLGNRFHT
jgi:hypothetical protein